MEFYQTLIFGSILFFGVFGNRKWFYGAIIFWVFWTVVMVFVPWLMALQVFNIAISSWLALRIVDWREKRSVDKKVGSNRESRNYGDIYIVTTESWSAGALDFQRILGRYDIPVKRVVKIMRRFGNTGLAQAVKSLDGVIKSGDIVCIVRGGGDVSKPAFDVFRSKESISAMQKLRERGVISVLGVGHAHDEFQLDSIVDYSAITPTEAAFFVVKLKT